jgi:hypothetical protein
MGANRVKKAPGLIEERCYLAGEKFRRHHGMGMTCL